MKELTIEEKAKRYDEAIIRGSQLWESDTITRENYEYIFPELAESEDERIRKAILELVRQSSEVLDKQNQNNMIAWLEKQCERKFSDIDNKFLRMRETKPANIAEFLDRLTTVEQEFLWEHIEKVKKLDREEREQKPAWSEKDESKLKTVISLMKSNPAVDPFYDKMYLEHWLKSLRDRVVPQPKQEWSEEDDRMYNRIVSFIPQHLTAESYTACINWLKSLRPQNKWKPSDEQMKALKEACDEHWEPDGLDPLYTLYQDLKKLR